MWSSTIVSCIWLFITVCFVFAINSENKKYESCDLRTDTFRVKPNSTKYFYRCLSKLGTDRNNTKGEWRRYKCKQKILEDCLNRTIFLKQRSSRDDSSDNTIQFSNFFITPEPLVTRQPCRISGIPYSGASCCVDSKTEADSTNVRLYLQCIPVVEGSDWGVWVRMECPQRKIFNSLTQNCELGFGATAVSFDKLTEGSRKQCHDGSVTNDYCRTDNDCRQHYICIEFEDDSKMCCRGGKIYNYNTRQQFVSSNSIQGIPGCPGLPTSSMNIVSCTEASHCPSGYYCYSSSGVCCPQALALCPDASLALSVKCKNSSQCPTGYYCPFGIAACCELSPAQTCPDGDAAVGSCVNNQCGIGFICFEAKNLCCRSRLCPDASTALPIMCELDKQCPDNFYCPLAIGFCCQRAIYTTLPITMAPNIVNRDFPTTAFLPPPIPFRPAPTPFRPPPTPFRPQPTAFRPPPAPANVNYLCPDDSQPAGACINGLCGSGLVCEKQLNICCVGIAVTKVTGRCLDGAEPVGQCANGVCLPGHFCTTGNLCCPESKMFFTDQCPDSQAAESKCLKNLCSAGYFCSIDNFCCPEISQVETIPAFSCPGSSDFSQEHCTAELGCSSPEFVCVDGQHCCPKPKLFHLLSYVPKNRCFSEIGPCINSLCPMGFFCNVNGMCCKNNNQDSRPYYLQHQTNQIQERLKPPVINPMTLRCLNGLQPISRCRNGLCEAGYSCRAVSSFCCPVLHKRSQSEINRVYASDLPPGSKCSITDRRRLCNGALRGLADCVAGICTCVAPAEKTGLRCSLPGFNSTAKNISSGPVRLIYVLTEFNDNLNLNFTFDFQNCLNDSDCNETVTDKCIDGICVTPKRIGESCLHKLECMASCKWSDCVNATNNEFTCQCLSHSYTYKDHCFKNCPSGFSTNVELKICEISKNTTLAEVDILKNSIC